MEDIIIFNTKTQENFSALLQEYSNHTNDILLFNEPRKILDTKYETFLPLEQDHMQYNQKKTFQQVLDKCATVFDAVLEEYPDFDVEPHLIDGAQPVFQKVSTLPRTFVHQLKKELYHLLGIGVLDPYGQSY